MGFIREDNKTNGNNNNSEIKTISSKVLATISASDIKLNGNITINNVSINKDKRYYIEFLGIKKLCSILISDEEQGNCIACNIGNYFIQLYNNSTDIMLVITKINKDDTTTDTFTDLVIYEEEVKYLDNKYLENDLVLQNSISLGRRGNIGACSSAIGCDTIASGNCSHAEGDSTTASGESSHAEGSGAEAIGDYSHAENYGTAKGTNSHAEGYWTYASSENQHVQGKYNIEDTEGKYAHIVGNGTNNNKRSNAHTLDWEGNGWYSGQVEGTNLPYTVSSKVLTTVPASNVKIDNPITVNSININKDRRYYIEFLGSKKLCGLSISEDMGNCIVCSIGNYSIQAFNDSTNIILSISKINKNDTTTDTFTDLIIHEEEVKYLDSKYLETDLVLQNSISLGRVGDIGTRSSAIGNNTIASGNYSHAEGGGTKASGYCSHSEGNNTTASGIYSHSEGGGTTASGSCSHAEGWNSIASGNFSHAEGTYTKASSQNQHTEGKYNIEDKANKYAHIVGNGKNNNDRSNAHTLDWNGNAWYAGKLSQEGTPTEDKDLATKKYVDDGINDTLLTTNISGTTLALTTDKYQTTTVADGTEITLPTVTSFTEIHLFFSTTTDLTLILPSCKWQNGNTPTISANKTYEFIFTYTTEWLGGVIQYE